MASDKVSPTFDNYSIHGCSKNTTSNKSNTSQPSTLKSLQNQKIAQLNCTIEDYALAQQALPGAHDYAPQKNSIFNNDNSFETSLDEDSAAAVLGDLAVNAQQTTTIQPELETPCLPNSTVRCVNLNISIQKLNNSEWNVNYKAHLLIITIQLPTIR